MTGTPSKPAIGPATITGYGVSVVALVGMALALVFPDVNEQTLTVIATGLVGLGSLIVTNLGRYLQAREQIRQAPSMAYAHLEQRVVSQESEITRLHQELATKARRKTAAKT